MIGSDNAAQRTPKSVVSPSDVDTAVPEDGNRGLEYARQTRLLPLPTRAAVVLAAFFLLVTFAQVSYLYWKLGQSISSDIPTYVHGILDSASPGELEQTQLAVAAQLDSEAITRRHESAAITQLGRLWTKMRARACWFCISGATPSSATLIRTTRAVSPLGGRSLDSL